MSACAGAVHVSGGGQQALAEPVAALDARGVATNRLPPSLRNRYVPRDMLSTVVCASLAKSSKPLSVTIHTE